MPRRNYAEFTAEGQSAIIWDTIVLAFAASRDLEWEVCEPPEGFTVDGQETLALGLGLWGTKEALWKAVKRNNLRDHVRVRNSRKRGGHVWLQKVGAEVHAERLGSEKVAPLWTKKRRRRREV